MEQLRDWHLLGDAQAAQHRLRFDITPETPDGDIVTAVIEYLTCHRDAFRFLGGIAWKTTSPTRFQEEAEVYQQVLNGGMPGIAGFCSQQAEMCRRSAIPQVIVLGDSWERYAGAITRHGQTLLNPSLG